MTRWISTLSLLLSILVMPPSADATVVLEVGLEEMSHASALVFHGVVEDVRVVKGMEAVVLLETTSTGFARTGLHQGLFVIEDAPQGEVERVVSQRPSGAAIARHGPSGQFILGASAPLTRHHPLNAFLEEVRHHVAKQHTQRPTRP